MLQMLCKFARLLVVAAIILKFYRKFYCSCDQSLKGLKVTVQSACLQVPIGSVACGK